MEHSDDAAPVDLEAFRGDMRAAGIESIVDPVLDTYVAEGTDLMSRLTAAVAAENLDAIAAAAHALKSSSGNIRARHLAALLEEMETRARGGDLSGASALLGEVEPAFQEVLAFLADRGEV